MVSFWIVCTDYEPHRGKCSGQTVSVASGLERAWTDFCIDRTTGQYVEACHHRLDLNLEQGYLNSYVEWTFTGVAFSIMGEKTQVCCEASRVHCISDIVSQSHGSFRIEIECVLALWLVNALLTVVALAAKP